MNEPILIPPIAGETIATVSSYPELVDAFRTMKARLGLSNQWCDAACDYANGITDKKLGPTQAKPIDPLAFSMFCQIFGVKFEMKVDLDAVRKMEGHWEQREEGKVAFPESRMSKKLLEKATPLVLTSRGKEMNAARNCKLTSELRTKIARKAGKKRMRRVTKAERSSMSKKGWETRRRKLLTAQPEPAATAS